jgi:hypothetical protein
MVQNYIVKYANFMQAHNIATYSHSIASDTVIQSCIRVGYQTYVFDLSWYWCIRELLMIKDYYSSRLNTIFFVICLGLCKG